LSGSAVARKLVVLDRKGTALHTLPAERMYRFPRFSPNGRELAFHVEIRGGVSGDIWTYSLENGGQLRLTTDSLSAQPEWDPDGKTLVFLKDGGLWRVSADGSAQTAPVLKRPRSIFESHITPDRRTIVFREDVFGGNRDILMASLDSPTVVRPLLTTPFDEKGFAISPDGRWLAYTSNESGIDEVYVRLLQENSPRWLVSRGGGREARWARDEIFYRIGDSVMVASVRLGTVPTIGTPRLLFTGDYTSTRFEPLYDVSSDGTRFAFVTDPNVVGTPIGVTLNWTANWKARQKN
jgi:Tol biopolymer transport system component